MEKYDSAYSGHLECLQGPAQDLGEKTWRTYLRTLLLALTENINK